ncbi:hypothetical protein M758_9G028600 [Ceratodon purpureus]|nr:hypothetical protein M758_9G028600 [Ceratodon purpureus]
MTLFPVHHLMQDVLLVSRIWLYMFLASCGEICNLQVKDHRPWDAVPATSIESSTILEIFHLAEGGRNQTLVCRLSRKDVTGYKLTEWTAFNYPYSQC